jgi:uncharacterized protein DUF3300
MKQVWLGIMVAVLWPAASLSRLTPAAEAHSLSAPTIGHVLGASRAYSPSCQSQPSTGSSAPKEAPKIPPEQLDALVAPIALYPDPLLAQVLAASTYPLELIQLQQWLKKNPNLKDKALADAVAKQPWDPSVQSMAALPEVVDRLANDIQWTTDLGNAFLAQRGDVMDAVQRMRKKAQDKGTLKTSEQMKVETKVVEKKEVIVIEQANPQVVYVPSYNPTVVYGAAYPYYPYPAIYYPYYYPGGLFLSFSFGVAMGAMWSGGWGYGCGWGHGDVDINRNNNFNRNTNVNRTGNNRFQHNPQHRGGAPYGDRATANRYGGTTRGSSFSQRQAAAQRQIGRQGGNVGSFRGAGGVGGPGGIGGVGGVGGPGGAGGLGGVGGAGGVGSRGGVGGDRIGGRSIPNSSVGSGRSSFGGGGYGNYSGSGARASSSRGASSMGYGGYGGRSSYGGYGGRSGGYGGGGYGRSGGGGFRGGGGGGRGGGGRR